MSKKTFIISLFLGITVAFMSSCDGNDDEGKKNNPSTTKAKTYTVDATSFASWSYFSFEKGKTVDVANFADDQTWDIGFHRTDIRLNGGESGKGQGAGLETSASKLEDVVSIPTQGFVEDVINDQIIVAMPAKYETQPMNKEVSKWAVMDMSSMPPAITLSGKVYVIRTAKGKFAKVKFTDYTNEDGKKGYVTFQYIYPFE